jgi:hypothetical protein
MGRRILRQIISVVLTLAIVFIAVPLTVTGAIVLAGGLSETAHRRDVLLGLQVLGIAAIFWGALFGWLVLCGLLSTPRRFSLRALLISTTLVAVVLGLIAYGGK